MIEVNMDTKANERFDVSAATELSSPHSVKDKVIVVTGAVGNLGLTTARALQSSGARTVLVDRSRDRLSEAYPELANSSRHAFAGGVDLADAATLSTMMESVVNRFGRIDGLVNTVGGYRGGKPVHETKLADWDFLFGVNLRTTLLCCRAVIPQMIRQSSGRIVNVGSRDALQGSSGYAAYSASKSAVLRLTESMAAELKAFNINVNCILPGTIDTPQNRKAIPDADYSKWVDPRALSDVVLFLLSDASRAIHGAALPVFGEA